MARIGFIRRMAVVAVIAAGAVTAAAATPSRASVISSTPTLPLLGTPYVITSGNCFTDLGVCIDGGITTLTSPSSSSFDVSGQHITSAADFSGTVTDLSHVPLVPVTLSGTVEQLVQGRTSSTDTGSWTTDLVSVSLFGTLLGDTVTVTLDPGQTSSGTTAITALGPNQFRIDSFFDVFVELSLAGPITLTTTLGPIHVEAVPEPSSIAVIATALFAMLALFRRRGGAVSDASNT